MGPDKVLLLWGAICAIFIVKIIHILNFKIPRQHLQLEESENIIKRLILMNPDDIYETKKEFESYFDVIEDKVNLVVVLYFFLCIFMFFLFQSFLNSIFLPPPNPGFFLISKSAAALILTLIVSALGWLRISLTKSQVALLRQELKDKYIILGIFEPD